MPRAAIRWAMRWTMVRVFPEPAPARISCGPSPASAARRCASFNMGQARPGRASAVVAFAVFDDQLVIGGENGIS